VFNFARFIKGGKIKIMNSKGGGGDRPYRHPHGSATVSPPSLSVSPPTKF